MKKLAMILLVGMLAVCTVFANGKTEEPAVAADNSDPFAAARAFYAKTDVEIIVPLGAGGGMDVAARNAAPFLQELLGAKSVTVTNKTGGSGIVAYNYLYNEAKRDGSIICFGSHPSNLQVVQNDPAVKYKSEDFEYLGTVQHTKFALTVTKDSEFRDLEKLKKATTFSVGGFGFNDTMSTYGALICEAIGNKGNCVIGGYGTAAKTLLAMAQDEVDAYCCPLDSLYRYYESGQCVPILIFAQERDEYWPDVPTIYEVFPNMSKELTAQMMLIPESDRMVFAPPEIPEDRAAFIDYCLQELFQNEEFKQATINATGYFSGALNAEETTAKCTETMQNFDTYRILDNLITKWMK